MRNIKNLVKHPNNKNNKKVNTWRAMFPFLPHHLGAGLRLSPGEMFPMMPQTSQVHAGGHVTNFPGPKVTPRWRHRTGGHFAKTSQNTASFYHSIFSIYSHFSLHLAKMSWGWQLTSSPPGPGSIFKPPQGPALFPLSVASRRHLVPPSHNSSATGHVTSSHFEAVAEPYIYI